MSLTPARTARHARATHGPRALGLRAGSLSLLCALALGTAGCSVKGGDNANVIVGKQQFVAKCGSCHILSRAGTKGVIGPNLDTAFAASLAAGLKRSTIRGVVEGQVKIPNPEGAMPKDLVSGAVLKDVAVYVAQAAARPGQDSGLLASAVPVAGAGLPAVEKAGKLQIPASPSGQLAYTTSKATATAGPLTVEMPNASGVSHNIAIQLGTSGPVLGASPYITKGTTSVTVTVKPGAYTYFCQVPGHRQAGMLGTLTVK
jgi:plastocyanin